jgi:hypothetical protein
MSAPIVRRLIAAAAVCLAAGALLAAPAGARSLDLGKAEQAARAAVAPEAVQGAVCVRPSNMKRRAARSRALCLLAHPAPEGTICRSLVSVRKSGGGTKVKLIRRTCLPLRPIEP